MLFQYPSFLFALSLLVIPVIIHLFNFRRYQKVYFSNVQFLKEIDEQQSSRRNLKERMVLAARILAITFLVLAFAKPFIPDKNHAAAGTQQVISIFLDNSYSMQNLNRDGTLLNEAKRRAKEIAASYNINDRFQLLTQDFEGKNQRLVTRDEFNEAVEAVKISLQSRFLGQILNRQKSLLDMYPTAAKSAFIISDFQSNMADAGTITAPAGIQVKLVQLQAGSFANIAVDSVALLSPVHRPGETEKLIVRLHNYATEKAQGIPLKLIINGVQKGVGSYTINANSVQYDTITFSGLRSGWQRCQLSLQDNPVIFDNEFYFTFNVAQQIKVLLINGGTPNTYLKAVFASDPFFNAVTVPAGSVDYAKLGNYPLIILSDVDAVSTGLAQQLDTYVKTGGMLVVFPSVNADVSSYNTLLSPIHAAFPDKLLNEPGKVSSLNLQSDIFKPIFEHYPQNPDLPLVKKYYHLNTSSAGHAENLMVLPGNVPFFVHYKSSKGNVYLAAAALSEEFSNLPRHALFVPLMFRIALLSGHDAPLYYTLGKDQFFEIPPVEINDKQVLTLTKSGQSIIPDIRRQDGDTRLYVADQLQSPGLYNLKNQDSLLAVIALNDNRRESDLSYLNSRQLQTLLPAAGVINAGGSIPLKGQSGSLTLGTELWKLCIILALVALAAETLLIRFYKSSKFKTSEPV